MSSCFDVNVHSGLIDSFMKRIKEYAFPPFTFTISSLQYIISKSVNQNNLIHS